jgi:hypothetical protein
MYDRGTSIDTFVGDHQFLNLTNCNIILTILDSTATMLTG